MKLHTLRTPGIAVAALTLSLTLAACSGDDEGTETSAGADDATTGAADVDEDEGAASQTFGEGCSQIPSSGAGSFDGMVKDPVATAASNNPLLSTLVTAVGAVDGLGDTLNSQEALTVFAPYNDAFAEIPQRDLNALVRGGQKNGQDSMLYAILAHHVLPANAGPDQVTGEQETLVGDTLTVEGDPESGMSVSDGTVTANVLCGNIPTDNATVYVIDQVLTGVEQ